MVQLNPIPAVKERAENFVFGVISKYGYPPFGRTGYQRGGEVPVYERQVSPQTLIRLSDQNAVVNNAVEEKVQQTFRRGFSPIEKRYEAKCPNCLEEFGSLSEFKLDDDVSDNDVDFSEPRPCPQCDDMVIFDRPDSERLDEIRSFFERANMRGRSELVPDRNNSISQSFLEVCREVAHDIQVFDDGWMIFERRYTLDEDGNVLEWELEEVFRAPPQMMRYSQSREGKIGDEYWICIECRSKNPESYSPETNPGECEKCGNRTYECFAYLLEDVHGEPYQFFTRGEFAHGSEYRPRFTYGYSPVLSIWQEASTLEEMDEYYYTAYDERRAPRGALVVRSSNAASVRSWNTEQMEKLNADNQHIPTFIDDTDNAGDPIKYEPLLEDPAQMQQMQMRNYFMDRISAKFGVTAIFQNSSSGSGTGSDMEIIVANRSMERLRSVFNDVFLPAIIGQIGAHGWTRRVAPPEEEDEQSEAQLQGRHLNNMQVAQQLGLEAEWTREDRANIKAGPISDDDDGGAGGGLGALLGGDDDGGDGDLGSASETTDDAGQTTPSGGRPDEPEEESGAPSNPFGRSDNAVTSGDAGYSNATYGETNGEVIDYLTHVQEQLNDEEDAQKRKTLVSDAKDRWQRVDFGPDLKPLRQRATRSDKSFQDVRKYSSGNWSQQYDKNYLVRTMYEILENYDV